MKQSFLCGKTHIMNLILNLKFFRDIIYGHAHGVGVQSLIIKKFLIFTEIFFVMD